MRIDLPCCPLKYCKYQNDGNCTDKSRYESCPLREMVWIPDNATNGDMIKDMFPNIRWFVNEDNEVFTDHKTINQQFIRFNADWWNTPYKRGDGE